MVIFQMMKELEVFEGEVSPTKKTVTVKKMMWKLFTVIRVEFLFLKYKLEVL